LGEEANTTEFSKKCEEGAIYLKIKPKNKPKKREQDQLKTDSEHQRPILNQARQIVNNRDQQCHEKNRQVGISRRAVNIEDQF
jgi:hypothetical protein